MGRVKHTPKKNFQLEDNFTVYDYRPIVKKKKNNGQNGSFSQKYFVTARSDNSNKQFYLGRLPIGITNNDFPDQYNVCKVCFKENNENSESNSLILHIDDTFQIVTSVDTSLLKGMLFLLLAIIWYGI